jgi:hypothetical protein
LQLQRGEADRRAAGDLVPIGPSEDGKGLAFYDRRTGTPVVKPLPPGVNAKDFFAKLTGARGGAKPISVEDAMPFIQQLQTDPAHKGKDVFELYQMVQDRLQPGGGSGGSLVVPGGQKPAAAPAPGLPAQKPVSDGRRNFGMLTSRADLEREVAAGNPYAIRYMDAQRENRINAELSVGNPNYGAY